MLTVLGKRTRYCDGVSRRSFLGAGLLGLGSLTLADVLRARAATPRASSHKAVIMIFLSGGPSHLDSYDMKPHLPDEFRGEFTPTRTRVPGLDICELMPRQAEMADKIAVVRGVKTVGNHTGNEFFSAYAYEEGKPGSIRRPALGSVVSYLRGQSSALPPYVSLHDSVSWENPYYLGSAHQTFRPISPNRSVVNEGLQNLRLNPTISRERLEDRDSLRHAFDTLRRDIDTHKVFDGLDATNARALEILSSDRVRNAFDLSTVPDRLRARYGNRRTQFDFYPGQDFLLARKLVEAGVSVVTLAVHGWDTHEKNFEALRNHLPVVDQALTALIADLEERGLLQDVAILMAGEMGRTPRITRERAGREHWPETGLAIFAGGKLKTGQVVGGSDSRGEHPIGRPITPAMLLSTLYHHLEIDPALTIRDNTGRPMYLLDERAPIAELI